MQCKDRILVVDSEPADRKMLEDCLKAAGYEIRSTASGEQALACLGPDIDLVLLDLSMQDRDSAAIGTIDVVKHIRSLAEYADLPIVVTNAPAEVDQRLKCVEAGANDFIGKPFDEAELRVRLASLLKAKHVQDALKSYQAGLEIKVAERTSELKCANDRLEALSTTDPMTGMPNHRAIISALDSEIERCQRFGRTCGVIFIDLDHFKIINERFGHIVGDRILTEVRAVIAECLRGIDTVGRWSGEEFVTVMPEADRAATLDAAERIRVAFAQHGFATPSPEARHGVGHIKSPSPDGTAGDGPAPSLTSTVGDVSLPDGKLLAISESPGTTYLTCSIGVAMYPQDAASRSDLIQAADRAMYGAKRLGRNQVRSSADPAIAVLDDPMDTREAEIVQGVVEALAMLVSARDCYTGRHTAEVADFAGRIALAMGLSPSEAHIVSLVGQLHDIGKVAIPDSVLKKADELTGEEWVQMRQHTVVGADVVSRMPTLSTIARAIRAHHERWDGQGYPDCLAGEEIPLAARIVSVADTFGAITSDRPYRKARGIDWAMDELRRCSGKQFDPEVVMAAERVLSEGYLELDAAA